MARDLNKVMLIGRLAADPELRSTPSGQSVVNFRVATSRQWNDASGQAQSQTEFSPVVAWGKLGETTNQYLRKGRQVYVEGRLQTRSWMDKNNQKHWRTEVIAENVIFLGGSPGGAPTGDTAVKEGATAADVPPPPHPDAGKPAQPKVPAAVTAPGRSTTEGLEEIRIEDIPF